MAASEQGKVGSGPDWYDVREALQAVGEMHEVHTTLTITHDPTRTAHLQCTVAATPNPKNPSVKDALDTRCWAVTASLPCSGLTAFSARVWSLAVELDVLLSNERWEQTTLIDLGG